MMYTYFASCPLNFEDLLEAELLSLGASSVRRVPSGLYFDGDKALLYRSALRLRTASSLRLVLSQFKATSREELYNNVRLIPWTDHLTADHFFACHATKSRRTFAPENFLGLIVKDAIADTFLKLGRRPSVDAHNPDLLVCLHAEGDECTLSLELGRSLFKRGFRRSMDGNGLLIKAHEAPLKENLAAALLLRADWDQYAEKKWPLVDPMCGTGTFLIEAYMIATNRAPNLSRENFGFERWLGFDQSLFDEEKKTAYELYDASLCPPLYGYDLSAHAVTQSQAAVDALGASLSIKVAKADATTLTAPAEQGFLISNPPYGERLLTEEKAALLYQSLGANLKNNFKTWEVSLLIPDEGIIKYIDVRVRRTNKFFNGPDKRFFIRFGLDGQEREQKILGESAEQLKNRMEKRLEALKKLAETKWDTNAFRLYDADLPEYNAACDIYGDSAIVQEYAPPATIPADVAKNRLKEILRVVHEVTGISKAQIFLKQRRRIKPTDQYGKEAVTRFERTVHENGLEFQVNLNEYVDSGLYLDHRPLRRLLKQETAGKYFLNLFSYTGSVSVAAAAGGAAVVCSVDSSKTYLDMARQNMKINQFHGDHYTFIKSDVTAFLTTSRNRWDIIYCDPPTFSNSKMRETFDIQKDHVQLIKSCMKMLNKSGKLYFSTHFRRFKLDDELSRLYTIKDLTLESLDEDFKRYPIHKLWLIQEKSL